MALLEVIFVVGLLFEVGNSQEIISLYSQPGKDVTLPCGSPDRPQRCSNVDWLSDRDSSPATSEAERGDIDQTSPRADRMSLGSDCSLAIKNVTDKDVGRFTCRRSSYQDVSVHLSLLSISSEPADPKRDDELRLECSLMRYKGLPECRSNPLIWVDDTRTQINEGVEKSFNHADCFSYLKVKRQSGNSKKFRCLVIYNNNNKVEIEADYTPSFRDSTQGPGLDPASGDVPGPPSDHSQTFIIVGVLVGVVLLLIIMAVLLVKYKKRDKVADVPTSTQQPDDPESNLTYVTVNHGKEQALSNVRGVNEDAVTYSTVKYEVKMGKDDDPSSLYSNISRK